MRAPKTRRFVAASLLPKYRMRHPTSRRLGSVARWKEDDDGLEVSVIRRSVLTENGNALFRLRPAGTLLLTALALSLFHLVAEEPEPRWRSLNHAARQAIERKDYIKLRATLEELWPLLPGNPQIVYNMAASDAVLGNRRKALEELGSLADAGLIYDLAADPDFKSLRDLPEYDAILRRIEQNRLPVARGLPVQTLDEHDLLPEDIAYDARKRVFLVSSVTRAKIIRANGDMMANAPWPVLALRIDQKRKILWAATGWLPQCANCRPEDKDKTALLSYQLDSGALMKQFDAPVAGLLGDMTISREGNIYVSEGIHGAVFRFVDGKFERLDVPGEFPSPQTPALSEDEQTLYVPDYVRGIAAMDLNTRQVRWLQPASGVILSGIDGLYLYRNSFVAVQNGTTPPRIVRFSLDLKQQEILEANTPGLGEPTHGTLVDDTFYFLANTGWSEFDKNGKKKPGSKPVVSAIRKIELRGTDPAGN